MNSEHDFDLMEHWETLGIEIEQLTVDASGTLTHDVISHADSAYLDEALEVTLDASMTRDAQDIQMSGDSSISIGETIGRGGMGLIRVATQHSLRREVVVKSARPDVDRREAIAHILGEARITGMLEHPNIVPIYDISRQDSNELMIVMKRIEGRAWSELLGDQSVTEMSLEKHIDILRQVANAVHYAHSKGFIHRDLKPDNVMLGPFGEVYVLDWGIAVTFEDVRADLPQAAHVDQLVGSPRYMAPEMVAVDAERLGPKTDVYLLGAILHEILTGLPPHEGESLVDLMRAAYESKLPRLDEVSEEGFIDICRRAMAKNPEERYSTALAFREALEECLRHRGSRSLADQAQENLVALDAWLDELDEHSQDLGRQRAYELLSACRFGFNQALNDWPENTSARDGLQRALTRMVYYELEFGSSRAASALVASLPSPDLELSALVEVGAAKTRRAVARLKKLETDIDTTLSSRTRGIGLVAHALGWAVLGFVLGYVDRDISPIGHEVMATLFGMTSLMMLLSYRQITRTLAPTRHNHMMVHSGIYSTLCFLVLWVYSWAQGVDVTSTLSVNMLMGAFGTGALAVILDRWLALMALSHLVAAAIIPIWPELKFEILGVAMICGMGGTGAAWSLLKRGRRRDPLSAHPQR